MKHQHPFDVTRPVSEMAIDYEMTRARLLRTLIRTKHKSDAVELKPVQIDPTRQGVAV